MTTRTSSQISYLRQNSRALAETCQPLWHPLGFVSCVIRDEKPHNVLRVHYWPKNERRTKNPDWPIHTHVYDLSSFVLMGRVRDMQYREKSGSEYAAYSVSYRGDDSSIRWTGRNLSVEVEVDQFHVAGEEYSIPVGSFHQTLVPLEESAITLVVLSNFQKGDPLVLGHESEQSYPYDRIAFDKERFWQQITKAVDEYIGKETAI